MNMITAIIKPFKLEELRQRLSELGVEGLTVSDVRGYGRQKGQTEFYRGAEYDVHFLPKLRVEIAVDDELAPKAVDAIAEVAQTGKIGDGKIFVSELKEAVRIRTGETGAAAL